MKNEVSYYPEIQKFIDSLSLKISQELNIGKPEMMINKLNVKID